MLDPSVKAKAIFDDRNLITNAKFINEAFSHKVEDQGKYFAEGGFKKPVKFTWEGLKNFSQVFTTNPFTAQSRAALSTYLLIFTF